MAKELLILKSDLDDLIKGVNSYKHCQATFHILEGDSISMNQVSITGLKLLKNESGHVFFPANEGEGYIITDEFNIEKEDVPPEQKRAMYCIKKGGIDFISLYLY